MMGFAKGFLQMYSTDSCGVKSVGKDLDVFNYSIFSHKLIINLSSNMCLCLCVCMCMYEFNITYWQ